jgi:cytochrome oxidase Cu insertion factor (SCO1/SenC/PrrC family)
MGAVLWCGLSLALIATAHTFALAPTQAVLRASPMTASRATSSVLRPAPARTGALSTARRSRSLRMATPALDAPAPAFDLPSDSGTNLSLKSLRGKWVVVYFYPKVFTQGCTCQAQK